MEKIKLQIVTPEKTVFSEEVDQVSLATQEGEITVLPNHIPLVTLLQAGELRYKKDNQQFPLAIAGGFAEVRLHNELIILADRAEYAHEIDVAKAEAARDLALKTMQQERQGDEIQYTTIQASLEKELNRIRVGNKYRKLPLR